MIQSHTHTSSPSPPTPTNKNKHAFFHTDEATAFTAHLLPDLFRQLESHVAVAVVDTLFILILQYGVGIVDLLELGGEKNEKNRR